MRRAIAWIAALTIVAAAVAPAPALADGDPASDELIGANVFYPFSPAVEADLQDTLNAEAAAAGRAHFPIKVALIDSAADLGAIPSLFAKPQQYADFLDQEISFAGTKTVLLVVMPERIRSAGAEQARDTRRGVAPEATGPPERRHRASRDPGGTEAGRRRGRSDQGSAGCAPCQRRWRLGGRRRRGGRCRRCGVRGRHRGGGGGLVPRRRRGQLR